jgi:hypothetical protein
VDTKLLEAEPVMDTPQKIIRVETSDVSGDPDTPIWEHRIHGIGPNLSPSDVRIVTRLIKSLESEGEHALIGFSSPFPEDLHIITASDWTSVARLPEERVGRRILRRERIVGYAHTCRKLEEVYTFAWNSAYNEAVLVALAPSHDDGSLLLTKYEEAYPGNEQCLLDIYPTIVGRYLDGLWISIVTRRANRGDVICALQHALVDVPDATLSKD